MSHSRPPRSPANDDNPDAHGVTLDSRRSRRPGRSNVVSTRTESDSDAADAVIVPIRSFNDALSRLESVLNPAERRSLMRDLAAGVLAAARPLEVFVATDDDEVAAWTETQSAEVLRVRTSGLSASVAVAVDQLQSRGYTRVVVAHADLPRVHDLGGMVGPGLVIAPDRHYDGSNVMCVPTNADFCFSYGPGSFQRHVTEAERLELSVTVVDDPTLSWDLDSPEDLVALKNLDCDHQLEADVALPECSQ